MVLTIGAVLLAAFLVPAQRSGYLDVAGFRAVRVASWTAAGWTVAALLMVPLTMADALGRPVQDVLDPGLMLDLMPRLSGPPAWLVTGMVALLVLAGCRAVLTWGWTVGLFGLAVFGALPVTFTGHSASGGAHDIATDSLVLHVLAATLWVGGLVAVLGYAAAARGPDRATALATAVPRFSRLALVCWLALAVTGIVNALVRIPLGALVGSEYGALVLAKAGALVALGVLGALHRRSTRRCGSPRGAGSTAAPRRRRGAADARDDRAGRGARPLCATGHRGGAAVPGRDGDRLRPRRAADVPAARARLALRPDLRFGGDRPGGALPARRPAIAQARRHLGDRADGRVARRLRGAAGRDELGHRPVRARHVQRAHGAAHAPGDAGPDPAGAGGARDARPAGTARRRARRGHPARGSGCSRRCTPRSPGC